MLARRGDEFRAVHHEAAAVVHTGHDVLDDEVALVGAEARIAVLGGLLGRLHQVLHAAADGRGEVARVDEVDRVGLEFREFGLGRVAPQVGVALRGRKARACPFHAAALAAPLILLVVVHAARPLDDALVLGRGVVEVGRRLEVHQRHPVGHRQAERRVRRKAPLARARVVEHPVGEQPLAEFHILRHRLGLGVALGEGLQALHESRQVGRVVVGPGHILAPRGRGGYGGQHLRQAAHLRVTLHFGLHRVVVHIRQPLLQLAVETVVHRLEFLQHLGVLLLPVLVLGAAVHVFQQLVGQPRGGELHRLGFLRHQGGHQQHREHQSEKSALHICQFYILFQSAKIRLFPQPSRPSPDKLSIIHCLLPLPSPPCLIPAKFIALRGVGGLLRRGW